MKSLNDSKHMLEKSVLIDEVDKKILRELINNSRISYSDIAERVHLSRVSVRERVIKLKQSGIIKHFTIFIDSAGIGFKTSVFFDIEVKTNMIDSVARTLAEFDEITIVYQTTGATSLHVHAQLENLDSIGEFMHNKLYSIDGITNVNSHILLKKYKSLLTYI
ncbi:Lrp/AsnC family transcriptional regulator [Maledivibacter halophilus]|uniref:Transcriptional regulator, AsnC family n=1 Tax=Maledivibacter halophilus TaxID=36842 RepID=A0A1T5KGQ4_9FIRM|nr:Lrp/AsnC family transcriptional regulator [Maledivibacter halophilus]SKC62810.1 transcriptional regulator, AsnC family [Maledivibacter halophilus]